MFARFYSSASPVTTTTSRKRDKSIRRLKFYRPSDYVPVLRSPIFCSTHRHCQPLLLQQEGPHVTFVMEWNSEGRRIATECIDSIIVFLAEERTK
jgi:hypothetical protein